MQLVHVLATIYKVMYRFVKIDEYFFFRIHSNLAYKMTFVSFRPVTLKRYMTVNERAFSLKVLV